MLRAGYRQPVRLLVRRVIVRGEEVRYSSKDQANRVQKNYHRHN